MRRYILIATIAAGAPFGSIAQESLYIAPAVMYYEAEGNLYYRINDCVPGSDIMFYSEQWGGSFMRREIADDAGKLVLKTDTDFTPRLVLNPKIPNVQNVAGSGRSCFTGSKEFVITDVTIEQHHGRINIGWIGNAADPGKYTFELQKSTDGNVFTSVSNFPAYAEPFTYRYDDELKEDARFYRIKVNCKEGNIYTTRTVAATGKEDITCYPTVATDHVNITLSNIQAEVDYTIINAQGQTVGAGTISQAKNTISVREYAPGKYFIFMHKDKGEVITKGFIRQ